LQITEVRFSKTLKKYCLDTSMREKRKGKTNVGNQALPKKIIEMLEKVYRYLNRRAYTSNAKLSKRRFINATIAVVALILLSGFMLSQVMSAIQVNKTISNVGTLKLSVDVGVYWDASFTNRTTTINWGTLNPGTTKSYSLYIRNEGNTDLTLSMSTTNWSPSPASSYVTLNWNYNGQTVNPNGYVGVTFTLTVSNNIAGVSSFSFDISLVGSG
jgi:hypothetical protein